MIFGRVREAMKLLKRQEVEVRLSKQLTDDPLTVELIERIAKNYDYHFEIVQRDGTVLRFVKRTDQETPSESGVW